MLCWVGILITTFNLKIRADHVKKKKERFLVPNEITDCLFYILLGSQETEKKAGKWKERGGWMEKRGLHRKKNVRSEGESAPFKASHLAFIWWIPHLLHVLVAVGSRSWIREASSFYIPPSTKSPYFLSSAQIFECPTFINPVIVAFHVRKRVRVRECRNLGVKRAIETGLVCPAPVLPIHTNVYTLSSTINGSQRVGLPALHRAPADPSWALMGA